MGTTRERQMVQDGAPFAEAMVLRAGYAYQQVTDWHLLVPPEDAPGGDDA